jgi:hypothetical protein
MVRWLRALFAAAPGLQLAPHALPAPWPAARIAIFERINASEQLPDGSLIDACFALSDRPAESPAEQVPCPDPSFHILAQAHGLSAALQAGAREHTLARLSKLYPLLLASSEDSIGATLQRLQRSGADPQQAATLARWLASRAPDAIAVKYAIALLGQYGSAADAALLMTLGKHELFTLACARALCKLLEPEPSQTAMWNLARRVHGLGRIHMVRELATTGCPEVQQWLLRDGYRNTFHHDYTACLCATGGKLLAALQAGPVDERLLTGAGEILQALLNARALPGQRMHDYPDGAAAALAWLECVQRQQAPRQTVQAALHALAGVDTHALPWPPAQLQQVAALARSLCAPANRIVTGAVARCM